MLSKCPDALGVMWNMSAVTRHFFGVGAWGGILLWFVGRYADELDVNLSGVYVSVDF
jgi:hypothetical protein